MDFSINHIGYLLDLIDANSDEPTPLAKRLIANALYGDTQFLESSANIGFLDALATGGVNMTNGFDASASGNIWSCILTMEGTVLFASATTKRHESSATGKPTFPFAVSPVLAGEGSIGANESPRPELWLPTWHAPASIMELSRLFSEGRTTLGKNIAQNGIDMLQALSLLGVDRGITAFERYGIYERRGQGTYVTAHLGRYRVPEAQSKNWIIGDLGKDYWLQRFRSFTQGKGVANHFLVLRKQLEDKLFVLSGYEPRPPEVQAILALLGEIQSALASSNKARESVDPLPRLSEQWVQRANDKTPAFRIARALAGLRGGDTFPLPLRAQLFPNHPRYLNKWIDDANNLGNDPANRIRIYTGAAGSLPHALRNLLARRLLLAEKLEMKDKPLQSLAGVALEDIAAFLQNDSMDRRIASLLPGLSLCDIPRDVDHTGGDGSVPAAFALLKLCLTPDSILRSLGALGQDEHLPLPVGMLAQLGSGHKSERAVEAAWRRLRASGLNPVFSRNDLPSLDGIRPERAAAALLIPLRYGAYDRLARSVLKKSSEKADSPAA